MAWLPPGLDEAAVLAAALERGVGIEGVAAYRMTPADRGGLIFGYANVGDSAIIEGIRRLGDAVASVRR
jgi:GntR family transcriptional regulator/MocR family aminotransferase